MKKNKGKLDSKLLDEYYKNLKENKFTEEDIKKAKRNILRNLDDDEGGCSGSTERKDDDEMER